MKLYASFWKRARYVFAEHNLGMWPLLLVCPECPPDKKSCIWWEKKVLVHVVSIVCAQNNSSSGEAVLFLFSEAC